MLKASALKETTKFWRDPTLSNLELLRATYVTHAFVPHTHEGFAIGVVESGAEAFDYRGAYHTAPAGHIVVINPGEPHTGHAATRAGWVYRMLYPDASLLQQAASQMVGRPQHIPFFAQPVIRDDELARSLLSLHAVLEESPSALERESRFLRTFAQLIARHADARPALNPLPRDRHNITMARDYFEAHYAEDVSLGTLAQLTGLSPFYFLRTFRSATGLTPHAYVTQVRVAQAKRLLLTGLPLTQVALDTGFGDQSHFTRRFKQIVGVAPGQYRRRNF